MSEFKGTPGPWECKGGDVFDAEGGLVVSLTNSFKRDKISRQRDAADPILIAAAPDLLKELLHLLRLMEPLESAGSLDISGLATLNGARTAIAKAFGQ